MNKMLLVLIDGRSVFCPVYGGISWDMQDLLLDDIKRIEVIRGPGGTVWGENAVEGVINIITKKASDTQGAYVNAGGGNYDLLVDGLRVGGNNGDGFSWRLWGKNFERGPGYLPGVGLAWDDRRAAHGGFRADWKANENNTFTALGSYFGGDDGQQTVMPMPLPPYTETVLADTHFSGQNILLRWEHMIDDESDWCFQTYYDQSLQDQTIGKAMWTTMDFDFQHRFPLGRRNKVIWGLNYRQILNNDTDGTFFLTFSPQQLTYTAFNGFLQDEIELAEDRWFLTVGTKLEQNNFSGFEVQPSIRLLWTPDDRHSVWGAISRAVSTPALYEENGILNFGPFSNPLLPLPYFARLNGTTDFKSEKLMAYEVGYRAQTTERFSWDIATYFNVYSDIHGFDLGEPVLEGAYFVVESDWENKVSAQGYGVELSASWDLTDTWRLWGFYDYQHVHYNVTPEESLIWSDGQIPLNQIRLQSSWTWAKNWEFDAVLRYVDNLAGTQNVPHYLTMDLRLGWRPSETIEVALVGQNLLDAYHYEFGSEGYGLGATEVRRTVFGQLTWWR